MRSPIFLCFLYVCFVFTPVLHAADPAAEEAKLKSLSQELSRYASRGLSASGSRIEGEIVQWAEAVKADGLSEALLDYMEPTDLKNSTLMAQFAYACEALGAREKAIDFYERVLAIRSKYGAVRLRLFPLLAEDDFEKAVALLPDLSARDAAQLGAFLRTYVADDGVTFEDRLKRYRLLEAYLTQVTSLSQVNLSWVVSSVDHLAMTPFADEARMGSLYKPDDVGDLADRPAEELEAREKALEQRQETHEKLCRALLKMPQIARDGFRRLAPFVEEREELAALALDTLKVQSRDAWLRRKDEFQNPEWVPMPTPEEYLVRYVWESEKGDWFESDALPAVTEASEEMGEELSAYYHLYQTEPAEFVKAALAFQESMAGQRDWLKDQALDRVVKAWVDRELSVDLWPLFSEHVEMWKRERRGHFPEALGRYADGLRRDTKVQSLLWHLSESYVGPKEALGERWEAIQEETQLPLEIQQYLLVIKQISREPMVLFDVLNFFEEGIDPYVRGDSFRESAIDFASHPLLRVDTYRDMESFATYLEISPFLEDLDGFRMYARQDDLGSLFIDVVGRIIQSVAAPEGKLDEIRQYLNEKPPTFGRDLLMSALGAERPDMQVAALFAQRREELEQLPVDKQLEFTLYLEAIIAEDADLSEFPENSLAVVEWLRGLKAENVEEELEALLAARSFRDVSYDDIHVLSRGRDLLRILVQTDRERADELFWKLMELVDEARAQGRWDQKDTGLASFGGELLTRMMSGSADLKALDFAFGIIALPGPKAIERSNPLHFQLPIKAIVRQDPQQEQAAGPITLLTQLYDGLGQGMRPELLPLAFDGICDVITNIGDDEEETFGSLITWLETDGSEGRYPAVAEAILVSARLSQMALNETKRREYELAVAKNKNAPDGEKVLEVEPAEVPDYSKSLDAVVAYLESAEWSPTGRLAFMESVLTRFGGLMDSRVAAAGLDLMVHAWEETLPVPEAQLEELVALYLNKLEQESLSEDVRHFVSMWREARLLDPAYPQSRDLCRKMLELSLSVNDSTTVGAVLADKWNAIDFAWLRILVRYESFAEAENVVKELWSQLDWLNDRTLVGRLYHDTETAAAVERFAEQIEEEEWRLLVRSWFAALPNAEGVEDSSTRQERLLAVTQDMQGVNFENPALLTAVLASVGEDTEAARELAEHYRRVGSEIAYTDLLKVDEYGERQRKQRMVTIYLRQSLSEGPSVIDERLSLLRNSRLANERAFAARLLCEGLETAFIQDWHFWSQEVLVENLSAWRSLFESDEATKFNGQDIKRWYALSGAMHAIAEQGDAFEAWNESMPEVIAGARKDGEREIMAELFNLLSLALNDDGLDDDKRLAALERIYKDPVFTQLANSDSSFRRSFLTRFVDNGLLTDEQFAEVAPKWVEANPRSGWGWYELANRHSIRDQTDDALQSWDKAIALIGDDDERYSAFQLGKVRDFLKVKNVRDARKLLEEFDRARLHEDYESEFDRLQQEAAPKPLNPDDVV